MPITSPPRGSNWDKARSYLTGDCGGPRQAVRLNSEDVASEAWELAP